MSIKSSVLQYFTPFLFVLFIANITYANNELTSPNSLPQYQWDKIKQQLISTHNKDINVSAAELTQQSFVKSSNAGSSDYFSYSVAISGETMVVGATGEDSRATGVGGDELSNVLGGSGAAYVFVRNSGAWVQQAYLKASNTDSGDGFGYSVAISGDTIVIGANREKSNDIANEANDTLSNAGAAYVFTRSANVWSQQAYLKSSNVESMDLFGWSVGVSGDTIIVGAPGEDSITVGVNNDESDNMAESSGAAYVFFRSSGIWTQQAYVKALNTDASDQFGTSVAVSGDKIVVGAPGESGSSTGINSDDSTNATTASGAAYIFERTGTIWSQEAYIKASSKITLAQFGKSVAMSGDTFVVGAFSEDSNGIGVNGTEGNTLGSNSGAAYIFAHSAVGGWAQQAYLKAANAEPSDEFGTSVSIDGDVVVVGAVKEDGSTSGVNGDASDNLAVDSGAAYVFTRSNTDWSQTAYLKPGDVGMNFGGSIAVSGSTVVVGDILESTIESFSGAVTVYHPGYSLGGSVTGLINNNGVTLQNNNGDDLIVNGDGLFTFGTATADESPYAVSVSEQPASPSQTCVVAGGNSGGDDGTGHIAGAIYNAITIACSTNQFTIGGTLTGLTSGTVVLQNNNSNELILDADGSFEFSVALNDLSNYSVHIESGPATCSISNEAGTLSGSNVTNILVNCNTVPVAVADFYTVNEDETLVVDDLNGLGTMTANDNGVLANDSDADGHTLRVGAPGVYNLKGIHGVIHINVDGGFTYNPPENTHGTATLSFSVSDGINFDLSTLTIEVVPVNDPPSFTGGGTVSYSQGGQGMVQVSAWATDISAGPVDETADNLEFNVAVVSNNGVASNPSLDINGNLTLSLSGLGGTETLEVSLSDGEDVSAVIQFDVVVAAVSDLGVSISNAIDVVPAGEIVSYQIVVQNLGPSAAVDASVFVELPAALMNASWTCSGSGVCSNSVGTGGIDELVDLPLNAELIFELSAEVQASPEELLTMTASVETAIGTIDSIMSNNEAVDVDYIGLFASGFE